MANLKTRLAEKDAQLMGGFGSLSNLLPGGLGLDMNDLIPSGGDRLRGLSEFGVPPKSPIRPWARQRTPPGLRLEPLAPRDPSPNPGAVAAAPREITGAVISPGISLERRGSPAAAGRRSFKGNETSGAETENRRPEGGLERDLEGVTGGVRGVEGGSSQGSVVGGRSAAEGLGDSKGFGESKSSRQSSLSTGLAASKKTVAEPEEEVRKE